MAKDLIFEELGEKEREILLKAFDYGIDVEGYVLNQYGKRIISKEDPKVFIKAKFAALVPGSLEIIDGTPTSISAFLEEREANKDKT